VLDFDALESRARYVDYEPHSPVIRHLWQVVRGMSEENKKKFLAFVTGTDRAPLKGLGEVALTIQRNGPDSNR
jgi:ubiquitin-protein ligase E3 A